VPTAELGWVPPSGWVQETAVHAKGPSLLVAVLVTSAIALLDAWTGDHAVLLGLLIAGPLLAAAGLLGCLVVATGAGLGAWLAHRRTHLPPAHTGVAIPSGTAAQA
jgi:hypothetical protein